MCHSTPPDRPCSVGTMSLVHNRCLGGGGGGTLGLDKNTRPAGGDRVSGVDGIGHGGDEDEEREGIQSRKAELEHVF